MGDYSEGSTPKHEACDRSVLKPRNLPNGGGSRFRVLRRCGEKDRIKEATTALLESQLTQQAGSIRSQEAWHWVSGAKTIASGHATLAMLPSGRYSLFGPDLYRLDRTSLRLAHLFDHFVGSGEQGWRNREAERLGSLEVQRQMESGRLRDW